MRRLKRWIAALAAALVLAGAVVFAQGPFAAQIEQFWALISAGGRGFTNLNIVSNGYASFGSTLGSSGYGFRDNAGVLQFSNSGGPWASLVGSGGPASFTTLSANYLCADAASQDACLTREGPSALAVGSAGGGAGGTIDASLYELNGSDALDLTGGYTALHGQLGTGVKLYGAVTFTQNLLSSGNPPTVSSCGTGTVALHSSNAWGAVTATGATACTVTFSTAYPNAAFCTIEDMTTLQAVRVSAISASAFTVTGLTSGDEFMYHCGGQ